MLPRDPVAWLALIAAVWQPRLPHPPPWLGGSRCSEPPEVHCHCNLTAGNVTIVTETGYAAAGAHSRDWILSLSIVANLAFVFVRIGASGILTLLQLVSRTARAAWTWSAAPSTVDLRQLQADLDPVTPSTRYGGR